MKIRGGVPVSGTFVAILWVMSWFLLFAEFSGEPSAVDPDVSHSIAKVAQR